MQYITQLIFFLIAHLPLCVIHALGKGLGSIMYYCAPATRNRALSNIKQAQIIADNKQLVTLAKKNSQESVKTALEMSIAWMRSPQYISGLFKQIEGWQYVEEAISQQHGLLLITPHLGNYDLAGRVFSEKLACPLTAMYRPPKQSWLEPIMNQGRIRGKGKTAPANAQGVRQIVKALRNKEAVIILPDQVPQAGEGVLTHFFGKEAYTMTLAGRLANMKQVTTLIFFGERLACGRGFNLRIYPFNGTVNGDRQHDAQLINDNIEKVIKQYPEQYLFSYNRYKIPAGVDIEQLEKPS